ncbi:MAG: hypothetical protein WAU07_01005 [Microgenomates group bacterium]
MLKNLFSLAVFFVMVISSLLFTNTAQAQTVGSHLGVGDIGGQINNIQVLRANGAGEGFPVTALLNVNTAGNNEQSMRDLQFEIAEAGFYPIIRITHVCDPALNRGFVETAIRNINNTFGEVTIVYGNEVNNQEAECSSPTQYLTEYSWVDGMDNVVPAALDFYNSVYPAATFLGTGNAGTFYSNNDRFVANAYGCVGVLEPSCYPVDTGSQPGTETQVQGYSHYSGKPYDLTEFSLSPEGRVPGAPDTNLVKVVEFIQGRAQDTGARYITPLVRNVCNNEGEWLLYVNGRLFTMNSTEVTENCEGSTDGGFDLDGYPFYDVSDSDFYITPIKSLGLNIDPAAKSAAIRSELAQSGYEAYCAMDGISIRPEYNSMDLINRFIQLQSEGRADPLLGATANSVAILDYSSAETPVWRDVGGRRFMMTSLEEYFSFKDVYNVPGSTDASNEVSSAAINSLLTTYQRCIQSVKTVVATQEMCEKLEDNGSSCALRSKEVPGSGYTMQTLIDDMTEYTDVIGVHFRGGSEAAFCDSVVYDNEDNPSLNPSPELREGILNVNLHMDRAYRLAFLVARITTLSPVSGNSFVNMFNFFTGVTESGVPRDEVLIIAFKVPDFATNRGGGDSSGSYYWEDASYLTRNALITEDRIAEINDELRAAKRNEIETNANSAGNRGQNSGDKIYCLDGTFPDGNGSSACKTPVGKAVVDIINGNGGSCSEDIEPANQITDAAGLNPIPPEQNTGKIFTPENGGDVLMNLFFGDGTHLRNDVYDPQAARTTPEGATFGQFQSIWDITPESWPPAIGNTSVEFYLTYPAGFEQEYIEEVLAGTFFTQQELANIRGENPKIPGGDPELKDRFSLIGGLFGLNGGSISHTFTDPDDCELVEPEPVIDPETGEEYIYPYIDPVTKKLITGPPPPTEVCKDKTFSISIDTDPVDSVQILGARLGFWSRTAQLKISSYFSQSHAYLLSCNTTEEFLLGNCAGGAPPVIADPVPDIPPVAQCDEGSPRITSGEDAQHVFSLTDPNCTIYEESIHDIPAWKTREDSFRPCNELYSYVACTYPNTLIENQVNADGEFVDEGEGVMTACEYVVQRAQAAGISPQFALAMWGEESGFSNYGGPDLGAIFVDYPNLGAQMTAFIGVVNQHDNYFDFLVQYSEGTQHLGTNQFCSNPWFVGRLKEYYDYLGP